MKYFIDAEFIEGFHRYLFGKRRHHIDLISIAILAEDGRVYFSISNEYKYDDASQWVKENVIDPMYIAHVHGDMRNQMEVNNFHEQLGSSNKKIAEEIAMFTSGNSVESTHGSTSYAFHHSRDEVDFYGWFCDYDWVLLCSLFGTMDKKPKWWPYYCRDLKQTYDEFGLDKEWLNIHCPDPGGKVEHDCRAEVRWIKKLYFQMKAEQRFYMHTNRTF